jgi:hypothetical protein
MHKAKMLQYSLTIISFCVACAACAIDLYVSPNGNDSGSGTKSLPFKSLVRARDAVRMVKQQAPVIVHIKGGSYYLEHAVLFGHDDSGSQTAPIVFQAAKGEEPVFTGSCELKDWHVVQQPAKLALLSPDVKDKIYVTDLKTAGISDLGDPTETGKRPELFCNGQRQTLARWPNSDFVKAGLAKGKTLLPDTYLKKHGTAEGVFEYKDNRQNRWAKEADARLSGYWYWDWLDAPQKVDKIDTLNKIFSTLPPYHHYGYKDSLRYFGLNLFCEIDQPGEWYLDRNESTLYWYPPAEINPNQASVTLSVFNAPFMIEMHDCAHVTLKGLSFQQGRGSAILIRGGKQCRVIDCRIEGFGQDGIHIEEGVEHGISGCLLRTFGHSGIKLKGGDRKQLVPAKHFIEHTVVEYFSLFQRTYEPAVLLEGCGHRLGHNRFRFSSSSAIRLEGNDCIIEYNEISHVVNESDDQGGLDIWYNPSYRGNVIRYNHWSDISGGTRHGAAGVRLDDMISGFHIYGNIFSRCGKNDFGGVQIHGGKDNLVENNLFYKCKAAVSFSSWGEKRWLEQLDSPVIQKKIFEDVDIRSDLYQSRYPELKNIRLDADQNAIKNNLLVDCEKRFLRDSDKHIKENNTSIAAENKTLADLVSSRFLKKYGLKPIPLQSMGPKNNKWLK